MNIKKLIASVTAVAMVATQAMTSMATVSAANVNPEWTSAVNFMKTEGLSSVANSVEEYMPMATVTREQAAKFFTAFAEKEFGQTANTAVVCNFADINEANAVFVPYITKACQMGIIKGANGKFMPKASLTKLQFLTILARIVKNNSNLQPEEAFNLLKAEGITKAASLANTVRPVSRIELAILFQRATEKYAQNDNGDDNIDDVLGGLLGGDDNNNTDNGNTDNNTDTDNTNTDTADNTDNSNTATTNTLTVALNPATPAGTDVASGADSVLVAKVDLTAGNSDVTVTELNFERTGFGEDAADKVALYINGARLTKAKSANSDDEFNVPVSPALVVKAGETVTVDVRVDTSDKTGEFALRLNNVKVAEGEVEGLPVVSNTFDVKTVSATKLLFQTGSVNSQVNVGETQADLAEFDLKNAGNVTNSDITVYSVTLKETGTIDQEEDLTNYALYQNGTKVADGVLADKYVTFTFTNPVVIKDGKTETFTVKADVVGGADKTVKFELDVNGDIVASASKYFGVNVVKEFGWESVKVEAGEITLYAIDVENDTVRDDTDDVKLGTLKVVNVAGKNLNLKDLAVTIETSTGNMLENVKAVVNGTSYDLDQSSTTGTWYGDTDIDVALPQGTTLIDIVTDLNDDIDDGATIQVKLNADTQLYIEETEDDTQVTDIVPSSLTWDDLEIKQPSVTVSKTALADIEVVKGAANLIATQYDVKANEVSDLTIDKVNVTVNVTSGGSTSGLEIKDYVSEVALYKGSVSEANKLDSKSGTKIGDDGSVKFDGFETTISADSTETFIVVVSTVDTDEAAGKKISVTYNSSDIEDDQNDTVTETPNVFTGRTITLKDSGKVVVNTGSSVDNSENENEKTLLAGTAVDVFSLDIKSLNEDIDVDEFKLTFATATGTDANNFKDTLKSVNVTLNGKTVTALNSDIVVSGADVVATFDNLTDFVIPTSNATMVVRLDTSNIGYEKVGKAVSNVKVSNLYIAKDDAKGVESNEKLAKDVNTDTTDVAKSFSIVPVVVTPAVSDTFGTDDLNATIKLATDAGDNTDTTDGSDLTVYLSGFVLDLSSITTTGTVTLFNGNGDEIGSGSIDSTSASSVTISLNSDVTETVAQDEEYRFETTAEASYRLAKDGVQYTVDSKEYKTNLSNTQDLGQYSKSN